MSLSRFALRVAACEALKGKTLAGDNVRDSAMGALVADDDGNLLIAEDTPFISVFTDSSTCTTVDDRSLRDTGQLQVVLETGVTSVMATTDRDTGEKEIIAGIPDTDGGMEATLDALTAQIHRTLSDPKNEWAEIWRRLSRVQKIEVIRTAQDHQGTRLAARQIRVTANVLPDPVYGDPEEPGTLWAAFRAQLTKDRPDLLPILAMMTEPGTEWTPDMTRAAYGHTAGEAKALGYALKSDAPIAGFTLKDARDD